VGSDAVVMLPPLLDQDLRFPQRVEELVDRRPIQRSTCGGGLNGSHLTGKAPHCQRKHTGVRVLANNQNNRLGGARCEFI
jgi:hypothetical protein